MQEFTITKKLAKHGSQSIIVIPKYLQEFLKQGSLVEIKIKLLEVEENDNYKNDKNN